MKKGIFFILAIGGLLQNVAYADGQNEDVFKGKLFAPNIILEQQGELDLTKKQFKAIRAIVVEVQTGVAEHEWDMQEAYQAMMLELNKTPIDEAAVLKHTGAALQAENQVKTKQVAMLVRLKNLLNAKQIAYLESVANPQ